MMGYKAILISTIVDKASSSPAKIGYKAILISTIVDIDFAIVLLNEL